MNQLFGHDVSHLIQLNNFQHPDVSLNRYELDEEGEFVPSAEDLRDFIEAYPEADIEDAPGYEAAVERHQSSPNRDTSLEDLVRSGIYPDRRGNENEYHVIE